jgi:chorismate mutase/prephenate dehydratase
MADKDPLADIRQRIDEIDMAVQQLVSERAECARKVAEVKREQGDTEHFYRPEREAQVLRKVQQRNRGPLSDDAISGIFREIMAVCLALEKPLKVAFLGPEGTYTHSAAVKHFGSQIESEPVANIEEVFRLVEAGGANFGVVPVENSSEGVINHTLDLFMKSSLSISGEVELRIRHNLMTNETDTGSIDRVYAHQQTLAQCRIWLDTNLPMAAELYSLPVMYADIEDEPNNTTRFVVIGKYRSPPSGADRTSLLVFAHNKPGSLFSLLEPLAKRNISMSNIESRPSRRGVWEYVFFIDIDGHRDDPNIAEAIAEIENVSAMVTILGSYPRAVL